MATLASVLEQAMELTEEERAELADQLYESVMCERQGLSPEWLAELDRRMAEHEADPSSALEWDDAMKVIFADPAE